MNQQILHILFSASPQCYPQSAEIQALFWVLKERARPQSRASYLPPSEVFRQYGLSGNGGSVVFAPIRAVSAYCRGCRREGR